MALPTSKAKQLTKSASSVENKGGVIPDSARPFQSRDEVEKEVTSNDKPNTCIETVIQPNAYIGTVIQPQPEEEFNPNAIPKNFMDRNKAQELQLLRHKVSELITLIDIGGLPKDLIQLLITAVDPHKEIDFDEDFNVRDELITQMKLVRAIRASLLDPSGKLKGDTLVTEVKSVLDASMRLSDMLNKVNKDLINQERMQSVEAAFMDVIGEMEKEQQLQYVKSLERRMKAQKTLERK